MPECQIIMRMRQIRSDSRKDRLIRDLSIHQLVQLGAQGITGLAGVRNHEFGRYLGYGGYADVYSAPGGSGTKSQIASRNRKSRKYAMNFMMRS